MNEPSPATQNVVIYTGQSWTFKFQMLTGTAATGGRMTTYCAMDTDKNYDVILLQNHLSTLCQELIPLV